jgi:hypothetical protein
MPGRPALAISASGLAGTRELDKYIWSPFRVDGQVMSKSAVRCGRVLFLSAIILCASASAEARHRKHYGGHRYLQQNAVKDRTWGGESPASDASSSQGSSFGPALAELIRGCSQEAIQLKNWNIDSIALVVGPDAAQQNALDQVRNASIETADILAETCPKQIPVALTAKFDALIQAVDAFITGLDALRPAMETFYISLNDEQKVRILAMSANNSLETAGRPKRSSRDGAAHRDRVECATGVALPLVSTRVARLAY